MKLPRYWAKGSAATQMQVRNPRTGKIMENFACWGWSDISVDEARKKGKQRANAVAELIRSGKRPDRYLYGDRPMREEILDEWKKDDAATTYAAVTLNAYGCQILNTATVMFVDVDLPKVSAWESFKHKLARMIGRESPSPWERQEIDALAKVEDMVKMDQKCGIRAYRTYGGLRYLFTHAHAEPAAESTLCAMDALGADPLYMQLCRVQKCFRARLNPKPWRCGIRALHITYPWADKTSEQSVRHWIAAHAKNAQEYATCSFINHFGSKIMDEEIARVVEFHDDITKAESGLKLA